MVKTICDLCRVEVGSTHLNQLSRVTFPASEMLDDLSLDFCSMTCYVRWYCGQGQDHAKQIIEVCEQSVRGEPAEVKPK